MREWLSPSLCALVLWGVWGFLPKYSTRYLPPRSIIVYEVLGAAALGLVVLASLKFRLEFHPTGAALGFITGAFGLAGGFVYLHAVTKGPVSLISVVTALYPALIVLLAYLFLGETVSARQMLGLAFALVAIVLLAV